MKHAEPVIAAEQRAETLIIDDASHLLWLHPRCDEIGERVRSFCSGCHSRGSGNPELRGPCAGFPPALE